MNSSSVIEIMQAALVTGMKVGAPILLLSLTIGLLIAVFQAVTQIHEQTLTFVPKLLITAIVLIVLGPWMIGIISDFTYYVFDLMLTVN
ncbi:flagellar biosynthesis protein FliQ [Sedimentibacter sp. MB31-C6]|uniref:flagellar biosynthesis protein FliQ n=1 Tax=Sedimentibacter sp. MB31-C6 TaxID=3109366 RepID=UPI002DDD7FD2|nr:flagellar biosynthesis protein FliQ [Sedimentibacter sp. MB36-C1]WSI04980.1 flagellar biosynthesis protein FliQ [Sedimentibacter sp. MB36-C1]